MFIKIGDRGVRVNAMHINSIEPIEETIEEKNGTETTHYGIKLHGTINPNNTVFYFEDEAAREEFLSELDNDRITIPLQGLSGTKASTEKKTAPKKGKGK